MVKIHIANMVDKKKMLKYAEETAKVSTGQVAKEIYELSQQRCPVGTGKLKNSGSIVPTETGYLVEYDCDYALYVDSLPQSMISSGTAHFLSGTLSEIKKGGVKID